LAIEKKEPRLKAADYSTICRRFNRLETKIRPRTTGNRDLWIAIDASGISVTNRGEWMRKIHRKGKITECKGFLKIHVAVDIETKEVVALEVTKEHVGDNTEFDTLLVDSIQNTGRRLAGVIADGSHDTYNNFEKCEALGIEPVIKIDNNAITIPPPNTYHNRRRGTPPRLSHAQQQLADKNKWKKEKRYGQRWHAEGFFSTLKRCYGTHAMAKKFANMQQELCFKAQPYNTMQHTI